MQWWFYHKVDPEEFLVSKCEEVKGNCAPDVCLKTSQQTALEAFARCAKYLSTCDLVEEFIATGVWPLSRDWSIPEFGEKGTEGLCRPRPPMHGFTGMQLYVKRPYVIFNFGGICLCVLIFSRFVGV